MPIMIVALVIGIIMVTAVIVPLTESYTDNNTTAYNTSSGILSKISQDEEHTVVYTTTDKNVTVDGTVVVTGNSRIICMTDQFILYSGDTVLWNDIDNTNISTTGDITVEIDGSDISVTDSADTPESRDYTVNWCFIPALVGDYKLIGNATSAVSVYLNSADQIYGSNWLSTTSEWFSFVGTTVTIGDETIEADLNLTPVSGVSDVYTAMVGGGANGEYTFVVDNNGADYTVHPRFYAVPASVSGVNDDAKTYVSLVAIIPLMAFIVLVVAAAAMIYYKKD